MEAASKLRIHPGEIPEEGLALEGMLDKRIFDLTDGLARPTSNLSYCLVARLIDGQLVLTGSLSASFELKCVRTLELFPYEVRLDPYCESIEGNNRSDLDLTDRLREDILLALPAYPHSPDSEENLFPSVPGPPVDTPEREADSVWDALDGLTKEHS